MFTNMVGRTYRSATTKGRGRGRGRSSAESMSSCERGVLLTRTTIQTVCLNRSDKDKKGRPFMVGLVGCEAMRACLKTHPVRAPGLQRMAVSAVSCRPRALSRWKTGPSLHHSITPSLRFPHVLAPTCCRSFRSSGSSLARWPISRYFLARASSPVARRTRA